MSMIAQKGQENASGGANGAGPTVEPRTVLVPMLNVSTASDLLHLAAILAWGSKPPISPVPLDDMSMPRNGPQPRIVVLGVVEVPEDQPLTTGMDMARSYRALFDFLPTSIQVGGRPVRIDRLVKVARDVPSAVRIAVVDEQASIVLAHWRGHARQPKRHVYGHILDALLKDPPCDIVLARPEGWHDASRILLPVRGGPPAIHALDVALLLGEHANLPLAVMHNVPPHPRPAATTTTGPLDVAQLEDREPPEAGPYNEFNEYLNKVASQSAVQIERIATVNEDAGRAVLAHAQPDDLIMMGMGDPFPPGSKEAGKAGANLPLAIANGTHAPLLVLRSHQTVDPTTSAPRQKSRSRQTRSSWVDMPFEYWFVENTYHGDEFRDPEEFLKLKRASGLTISVALLASNDGRQMHSIITGLKRVLMDMHPLADQIAVIDAGSDDETLSVAHSLGVDAFTAAEILPDEGSLHGRGESWWKSLAVLPSDIIVWLDPRAARFHPSSALALAGPLLRTPSLQIVKALGSTQPDAGGKGQKAKEGAEMFSPSDVSWGGFVVPRRDGAWPFARRIRVQSLSPADLAALTPEQFAALPPRTILQVLCPSLAGVAEPFGRDFAGRRSAMLQMPVLTGHNLELGLLLSVAAEWGTRAVAQVELRHAQPALPPQPGVRNAIDLLQILSRKLEDRQLAELAMKLAERVQKHLESSGDRAKDSNAEDATIQDTKFQVRALAPVERPPMSSVMSIRRGQDYL